MIRLLRGKKLSLDDGTMIIETESGIGFRVFIPGNSALYFSDDGDEVTVYTAMTIRENDVSLYGFQSTEELDLFQLLMTVKGVGAKAALAIMGTGTANQIKQSIAMEDTSMVQQAPGIGKRTADRIILELKDKVEYNPEGDNRVENSHGAHNQERETAIQALVALGYSHSEAEEAVGMIEDESLDSEAYIKAALRNLF